MSSENLLLVFIVVVVLVVIVNPNKFNLNCLQPAHSLDTRHAHLQFVNTMNLFCFSLILLQNWITYQFHCSYWKCVKMRAQTQFIAIDRGHQSTHQFWWNQKKKELYWSWVDFELNVAFWPKFNKNTQPHTHTHSFEATTAKRETCACSDWCWCLRG